MYVCPNCNTSYENEVSFCGACGTKVVAVGTLQVQTEKKEPVAPSLFVFLSNIAHISTGMLIALALTMLDMYIGRYSIYIYPEESCSILAMVMSSVGMGLSIVALIISLVKGKTAKTKFAAITNIVLAAALFVVSLALVSNI